MRMMIPLLASLLMASPLAAQTAPLDRENGRYSFKDVPEGVMRLDTRSGQVSLCSRRQAGWTCQAVPDDRVTLENEIARLESENAEMRRQAGRGDAPSARGGGGGGPGVARPDPELKLPTDRDLDRMMSFLEKMWRRLIDMVQSMQKEMDKKSNLEKRS